MKRAVAGDTLPANGYLSVDVLLVIYTHSFCDTLSQDQVEHILGAIDKGRELDVAIIDRLLTLDQFKQENNGRYSFTWWEVDGIHSVRNDLYALGYEDSQFSAVFVFFAWENTDSARASSTGRSYGVISDFLDRTSYAWVNTYHDPGSTFYYFVHEFHHQLDHMFAHSGLPEYPHADRYADYDSAVFDDGRSFNGWMLREWPRDNWALMDGRWGTVSTFDDADADNLPDSASELAMDEFRFGSSWQSTNTDGDGLGDLEEFAAGHMASTNPVDIDTDNDGLLDGEDIYPLDKINPLLSPAEMILDGTPDSLPGSHIVSFEPYYSSGGITHLYGSYVDTGIYLCFDVTEDSMYVSSLGIKYSDGVRLRLDAQSDGFLAHGNDNYLVYVSPQGPAQNPAMLAEIILDDGSHDPNYVPGSDVAAAYSLSDSGYCIEMFLRENVLTSFNVEQGLSIRMQCDVLDRNLEVDWPAGAQRAQAFTKFISFEFGEIPAGIDDHTHNMVLPTNFEVFQNCPNPFNPVTTIKYFLPRRSHVTIEIYNLLGQKVRTLVDRDEPAGLYTATWDGTDSSGKPVATGVYLYRLHAGDFVETKKMLLLK
jgi:hypothetical protein